MRLPSISKFLDISNSKDIVGEPKIPEFDENKLGLKEVFLSWDHLTSMQDKRGIDRRYIRSLTIIGIFVGILLLIMQEFFVILIIGSFIFFTRVALKTNPENVRYEISNHGLLIGENMYYWNKLIRFFFMKRGDSEVIAIDTTIGFPGRLFIPFNYKDREVIKETLLKYLYFLEEEPKTFFDNAYDRVVRRFTLEEELSEEENKSYGVRTDIEKEQETKQLEE